MKIMHNGSSKGILSLSVFSNWLLEHSSLPSGLDLSHVLHRVVHGLMADMLKI
jgi:hypothetical protein